MIAAEAVSQAVYVRICGSITERVPQQRNTARWGCCPGWPVATVGSRRGALLCFRGLAPKHPARMRQERPHWTELLARHRAVLPVQLSHTLTVAHQGQPPHLKRPPDAPVTETPPPPTRHRRPTQRRRDREPPGLGFVPPRRIMRRS